MSFDEVWNSLVNSVEGLPADAELLTPLSQKTFRVTEVGTQRVGIEYLGENEAVSLQRNQFETLYQHFADADGGFDLDRLPPNAEPYASILSLHPEIELDENDWKLTAAERPGTSPLLRSVSTEEKREDEQDQSTQSISDMLDNLGDPKDKITCPIDGCQYSHRSASSVARHVSGSSTDKHIWANTSYSGWRDFVSEHGESPG